MKRYLKLLILFWSASIAAELEYRFNFLIATLSSIVNLVGSIFGLFLFYRTGYTFQGWNWQEAMIVLGLFTLLQGFSTTFLVPNLNSIVQQVEKGTLDFVLLKPISSQFWLSTRIFSPWGLPDILFGTIIIIYAGIQLNLTLTNYLISIIPICFGIIILYSLWFMLGATSIWFVKVYNVTEVLRGLIDAGRYPMAAYPSAYRFFFTFIVPVAFLTTIPAQAMLGKVEVIALFGAAILAFTLFFAAKFFWEFAVGFYTSASS
jgi:ABC-2 type transport system permease protein